MADKTISDLTDLGTVAGTEIIEVSRPSTTIRIAATTISAQASDNSYNDSANGFVAAGFAVGDRVNVTGFTGDTANNIYTGVVTALTAGKMTIGGTDGDVIVDDAAGEAVVIAKWVTRRANASLLGGGATIYTPPLLADFPTALNIGAETTLSDTSEGMNIFTGTGGSGTTLRCRLKAYPTPPFSAIFKLRAFCQGTPSDGVGLMIRGTGSGKMYKFGIELSGPGGPIVQRWNSDTSFSATVAGGSGQGSDYYAFKFIDDGTNHIFQIAGSIDGPWFTIYTAGRTAWIPSPDQIGFGTEDQSADFYNMLVQHYVES